MKSSWTNLPGGCKIREPGAVNARLTKHDNQVLAGRVSRSILSCPTPSLKYRNGCFLRELRPTIGGRNA